MSGVREGALLWTPPEDFKRQSAMAAYIRWLAEHHGLHFASYAELQRWSCAELERFWVSISQFFDVRFQEHFRGVLSSREMPGMSK